MYTYAYCELSIHIPACSLLLVCGDALMNFTKLQSNAENDDRVSALIAHNVGRMAQILFLKEEI